MSRNREQGDLQYQILLNGGYNKSQENTRYFANWVILDNYWGYGRYNDTNWRVWDLYGDL